MAASGRTEGLATDPRSAGSGPLAAIVESLADRLESLAGEPEAKLTCDGLIALIGSRSHAVALLIFSLLNLLPGPPGYSVVIDLVIISFALLLTLSRPMRLWPLVGHRRLPLKALVKLMGVLRWLISLVTRVSAPRLFALTSPRALPFIGIFGTIMGAAMLVPIPLTNTLPSIALALVSLGVLNRDGVFVIAGFVTGLAGLAILAFALWVTLAVFIAIYMALNDTGTAGPY